MMDDDNDDDNDDNDDDDDDDDDNDIPIIIMDPIHLIQHTPKLTPYTMSVCQSLISSHHLL